MSASPDELSEAEEEAWCGEHRAQVASYLEGQGVAHGGVGDWPAWHIAPYLSVWAIQSLKAPGRVGWWAISGDLPSDYCAFSPECDQPRWAVGEIARSWREALAITVRGAETIGDTGLPIALADLLSTRAELLMEWVSDESLWRYDV